MYPASGKRGCKVALIKHTISMFSFKTYITVSLPVECFGGYPERLYQHSQLEIDLRNMEYAVNDLGLEACWELFYSRQELVNLINTLYSNLVTDATKEYVRAKEPVYDGGIHFKGLSCCTVLIGAYDNSNGRPIAGVVSRPFTPVSSSAELSSHDK